MRQEISNVTTLPVKYRIPRIACHSFIILKASLKPTYLYYKVYISDNWNISTKIFARLSVVKKPPASRELQYFQSQHWDEWLVHGRCDDEVISYLLNILIASCCLSLSHSQNTITHLVCLMWRPGRLQLYRLLITARETIISTHTARLKASYFHTNTHNCSMAWNHEIDWKLRGGFLNICRWA